MATTLHDQRSFLLQRAQPAMAGLIDGSLSTLAPIFAVAFATHQSHYAFLAGLATAIGAGVSMAFSEGLSDTGDVTGRGLPYLRGTITGAGTFLGGILHTLPFLIPQYRSAVLVALAVIALELLALAVIRRRFFGTSFLGSLISVTLGGAIIATISVVLGQSALCRRPRRRVSLSAARSTGARQDEMKAAVLHAIGEPLRIEEVQTPLALSLGADHAIDGSAADALGQIRGRHHHQYLGKPQRPGRGGHPGAARQGHRDDRKPPA